MSSTAFAVMFVTGSLIAGIIGLIGSYVLLYRAVLYRLKSYRWRSEDVETTAALTSVFIFGVVATMIGFVGLWASQ
ncbi:hypothetical protein QN372_00200 [Undibacterium sp. RTI2.1]|uniref:hypothetical protein n=1 Tax=unclassified Undibacterium TaxID=2630295 RepID=UPI002AB44701|nr:MULTISPECIES: hypothetical protein [unclassified Undibacterium]MDY7537562.1 hypothetical protein [Undibacterium sp. 5I1]MEB0029159.1 hypothetical protein [Undibacterium sp. RTI2.1]MEB0115467.1 hypothetical protein [Undibacterium sp. RTI2.2]MEB0231947.1 hypothetical protein [Undibacterium sp. 10I3]MEB0256298.1 hypothetical protein [Undibacterium sp. 5I1]